MTHRRESTFVDDRPAVPNDNGIDFESQSFWRRLHEEIQQILTQMDQDVLAQRPDVAVHGGATNGANFALHSYRTYDTPAGDVDAVVAGVTFVVAGGKVEVAADISGEQLGDLILEWPPRIADQRSLVALAKDTATEMSQHGAAIAKALQDGNRRIEK